jgi:RNA polymerase sigma factor (sigma-70 family)
MNRLLDQLRQAARRSADDRLSDGQLLERFILGRDEAAFTALLRRHGPMVFGVCRRVVGTFHDAEDAFQATFLVLARKAASVRRREAVGSWLYGVAYRTALAARARVGRHRRREKQVQDMPERQAETEPTWPGLQALLDQELNRLPDLYRLPVVLCALEGRSRREVARQLNIPEGTVSSRLATGRRLLAKRLARQGLALSGASVAALLAESGASASVPAALLASTTKAALLVAAGQTAAAGLVSAQVAALSEGVLRMMFVAKLKAVTLLFSGVAAVGLGTGGLWQAAAVTPSPSDVDRPQAVAQADPAKGGSGGPKADDPRRASDREQELREQLEKARREAEALRVEVERLRAQAEAERKQAKDALRAALEEARRYPGQATNSTTGPAPQTAPVSSKPAPQTAPASSKPPPRDGARSQGKKDTTPVNQPETTKGRSLNELEQRRRELLEQLKALDAEERKALEGLKPLGGDTRKPDTKTKKQPAGPQVPVSADKLERILDRLERLEKRLDRLEGSRPPSEKRLESSRSPSEKRL